MVDRLRSFVWLASLMLGANRAFAQIGTAIEDGLVLAATHVAVGGHNDRVTLRRAEELLETFSGTATRWIVALAETEASEETLRLLRNVASPRLLEPIVAELMRARRNSARRGLMQIVQRLAVDRADAAAWLEARMLDLGRQHRDLIDEIVACVLLARCVAKPRIRSCIERMAVCPPKEVVAICHRLEVAARRGSLSGFDRALALKQLRRIRRDGVAARGVVPFGEGSGIGGDVDAVVLRTSLERAVAALAPADRDAVAGLQLQLREGVARDRVRAVRRLADLVRLGLRGPLAERVVTDLCETVRLGGAAARVAVVALGRVHTPVRSVPIRQALELAARSEDAGLRAAAAKVER